MKTAEDGALLKFDRVCVRTCRSGERFIYIYKFDCSGAFYSKRFLISLL